MKLYRASDAFPLWQRALERLERHKDVLVAVQLGRAYVRCHFEALAGEGIWCMVALLTIERTPTEAWGKELDAHADRARQIAEEGLA